MRPSFWVRVVVLMSFIWIIGVVCFANLWQANDFRAAERASKFFDEQCLLTAKADDDYDRCDLAAKLMRSALEPFNRPELISTAFSWLGRAWAAYLVACVVELIVRVMPVTVRKIARAQRKKSK